MGFSGNKQNLSFKIRNVHKLQIFNKLNMFTGQSFSQNLHDEHFSLSTLIGVVDSKCNNREKKLENN